MELSAGTVVAERFRLVRQLGEGGMGAVWLAHHVKLDTPCAVKFIHSEVASAAGVAERFEREAKIAAQLRSPHVVHVLDYGVYDGVPYIGMEYLDGEDLSERLAARGRLTPEETVDIVAQVARALAKAHAAGLVHRDLKPENVFLVRDDDGELVKVLDFGIAKAQLPMVDAKTRTGTLLGTPRFMSPEQAQGSKTLDHRSDLWSLGVIAYRCIVGALPFDSDALGDLLMQIMVRPLPVPSQVAPGLPPSFDALWQRAAARDPAQRFQSAKELAEALAAAFGLAPVTSGRAGIGGPTPVPRTTYDPGPDARPGSLPSSPSLAMGNAATMLPGTQSPSHSSGLTPAHAASAPPEQTMSPASRTFAGAPAPKRASPVLLLAIGMIVGVAAVVGVALVALHGKSNAPAAETHAVAPPPAATTSEPVATAPSVEPAAAVTAAAEASATASATAAPVAPTTPLPAPPPPPPHVVAHPRPPVEPPPPPPAPTRRGKVHIAPPAN